MMMKNIIKAKARKRAISLYSSRNGRNPRCCNDGSVTIDIDGNGSQVVKGKKGIKDVSGGRIYVGQLNELAKQWDREEEIKKEEIKQQEKERKFFKNL
jgi:hypothetical protein